MEEEKNKGEELFATFMLSEDIEIAIPAGRIVEAIKVVDRLLPLPGGVSYLAGLLNFRGKVIPVINLKKRLGIPETDYGEDPRIAVVQTGPVLYGLLFEDIRDVLRVGSEHIEGVSETIIAGERIVSGIIKLQGGRRLLEILDVSLLLACVNTDMDKLLEKGKAGSFEKEPDREKEWVRYLVFVCGEMEYGVRVSDVQEITFVPRLNETFKSGSIEGAMELRGMMIPVIDGCDLLIGADQRASPRDESRVIILHVRDIHFGIKVNAVVEIRSVEKGEVVPVPCSGEGRSRGVIGMLHLDSDRNIMLINMDIMLDDQFTELSSMASMKNEEAERRGEKADAARHLITEHSYLVFRVERDFAVELHNVREILENCRILPVPQMGGILSGIIDLRGQMVPVVNLRRFFGYSPDHKGPAGSDKYIVTQADDRKVALAVDDIITIQKQERFFRTPSLNPQLRPRQDALDRTIEMLTEDDISENVLVVNVRNLIKNHLSLSSNMAS